MRLGKPPLPQETLEKVSGLNAAVLLVGIWSDFFFSPLEGGCGGLLFFDWLIDTRLSH